MSEKEFLLAALNSCFTNFTGGLNMPNLFTEDTYEQAIIELFENMGYEHLYAPDLERDYSSPFLDSVLRESLVRINRGLPVEAIEEALSKLKTFDI